MNKYIVVGEVLKPQGVRGEIKLRPITDDPGRFEKLKDAFWELNGEYVPVKLRFVRFDGTAVYLKIEGVEDRDEAEKLRGRLLCVDRDHAVKLEEGTYFIVDLVGLRGIDTDGNELGVLSEVMQPGTNDVYVFTDKKRRRETLVPVIAGVVVNTDIEGGTITLSADRLREVSLTDEI